MPAGSSMDPLPDGENRWSKDFHSGFWFHVYQVSEDPDAFVWEIWSPDRQRKISQSADGQTYVRFRVAGIGARRALQAAIQAAVVPAVPADD